MTDPLPASIVRARLQLMLKHPFLASAIARLPLVNAEGLGWCETAATDGYYIYLNPSFCEQLSDEEIGFVLAHEVFHCVLGHLDRMGTRNSETWNAAVDYATNWFLVEAGLTLPVKGLYDRRYRGMVAERIYEEIKKKERPKGDSDGEKAEGGLPGQQAGNKTLEGAGGVSWDWKGFDLHVDPDSPRGQALRAKDYPSAMERQRLRRALTATMPRKLHGMVAGLVEEEIRIGTGGQVGWQQLLARFFSSIRRNDYRLYPFNKKHLWRGYYLPSMGVPGPSHIVVALDTSGSMSTVLLSQMLAEIDRLRSVTECSLTLIQCDASIQCVKEFEPFNGSCFDVPQNGGGVAIAGRGGTDLRLPFRWVADQMDASLVGIDALIYFTDGFGPMPTAEPWFPVIWIMPEHGEDNVPFGQVLRVAD